MAKKLKIYTDGASKGNPGPMTIGVVIYENNNLVKKISKMVGHGTNNQAEYTAVIIALEAAKYLGADEIEFLSDSQLLVNQLNGNYKVHSANLKELHGRINELEKNFKKILFKWIPRHENRLADGLSNGII